MYAIRHKKTGEWVYGTDHRYHPRHQLTSAEKALTFNCKGEAIYEFFKRNCSEKLYEVVEVKLEQI